MNHANDDITRSTSPAARPGAARPGEVTKSTIPATPAAAPTLVGRPQGRPDADAVTMPGRADAPTTVTVPGRAGVGEGSRSALTRSGVTHLDVDATRVGASSNAAGSHHDEVWGDFELGELIGRGGMGAVYRGRQISLDRPVAIKVLSEHLTHSDEFRKRFLLEARAAARINSPHVVQVYFAGAHASHHYFAMEYVEGVDLAHKLREGFRPDQREALQLVIQGTRGLVALGEHKIVHRDIKPANFMVTTRGQLKLMDFGLVKFASETHGLTLTGTVMGTVSYFSPEQGRGENCDQRTDLYAMGVLFYELLTGKLPFTGGDVTSVIYQHIHSLPKPPRQINPEVAEPYQSVVLKCLEKEPARRYQNAAELLADLERIHAGQAPLALTAPPAPAPTSATSTPRHATPWLAALALAALAIGVSWWWQHRAPVDHASSSALSSAAATPATVAAAPPPPVAPLDVPPVLPVVPTTTVQPIAPAVTPPPLVTTAIDTAPAPPPVAVAPPPPPPVESAQAAHPVTPVTPPPKPEPEPIVAETPPSKPAPVTVIPPSSTSAKPVPAVPATPATRSESTLRIQIPLGAHEQGSALAWWLSGAPGRAGRLDARTTTRPDIAWSASGVPGEAILHAVVLASGRQVALPLRTLPDAPGTARTLSPFVHLGNDDDPPCARLARDPDGSWWGLNSDKGVIVHLAAGWLVAVRWQTENPPRKPIAVVPRADGLYVLDADSLSVRQFVGPALKRSVGNFVHPTDLAIAADGTLFVADQKAGGIVVMGADGQRREVLSRTSPGGGGFDRLTHLCLGGDGTLYALDTGLRQVVRYDRQRQPLPPWPLAPGDLPVDLAVHAQGLLVLMSGGELRVLGDRAQAAAARLLRSAATAHLADDPGPAAGVCVDASGEILVAYPDHALIARHDPQGLVNGLRNRRLWSQRALTADGQGRLLVIDAGERWLCLLDGDGFCVRRFGGPLKKGGSFGEPAAVAVAPDGSAAVVLDSDTRLVTRFALDAAELHPLTFGGRGQNPGQFDSPVALAMDSTGATYVLDQGQHRVDVFDARGAFVYAFGRNERGNAPDQLRAPRLLAVHPDGGSAFVYDDDAATIKCFALDPANRRAQFSGTCATKGEGPGQLQRLSGLGCDRLGLLYLLDGKRNDLQVFDTRVRPPVVVATFLAETLDLHRLGGLGLSPDGQVFITGDGGVTGLRW